MHFNTLEEQILFLLKKPFKILICEKNDVKFRQLTET